MEKDANYYAELSAGLSKELPKTVIREATEAEIESRKKNIESRLNIEKQMNLEEWEREEKHQAEVRERAFIRNRERKAAKTAKNRMAYDTIILDNFIKDRCVVRIGVSLSTTELLREVRLWLKTNGFRFITRFKFSSYMKNLGFTRSRQTTRVNDNHGRWMWKGIALLKSDNPIPYIQPINPPPADNIPPAPDR